VFADPVSEASIQGDPGRALKPNDDFNLMLERWGVRIPAAKVVGDLAQSLKVNYQGRRGYMQVNYLPWINIDPANYNEEDVVISQLGNITMATAGSIETLPEAKTSITPLIRSSNQAMLLDATPIVFAPNPAELLSNFRPAGKRFTLSARITGTIESAFADGPPKDAKEQDGKDNAGSGQKPAHKTESDRPVNIILVADSDLLQDKFWVQSTNFFGRTLALPTAANADLAANALESLGGSPDLISVRSRGSYQRPFTLVAELARKAESRFRAKEQELSRKLRETESRLNELQRQRQDSASTQLTPEQQAELEKFRSEKVRIRKELRRVQYQLRADIEQLETMVKAFNIAFVPGLLTLVAFLAWILRRARD
ncbi:MAG: ABC transporter, partial [Deltaproteobacteria bacterium]